MYKFYMANGSLMTNSYIVHFLLMGLWIGGFLTGYGIGLIRMKRKIIKDIKCFATEIKPTARHQTVPENVGEK